MLKLSAEAGKFFFAVACALIFQFSLQWGQEYGPNFEFSLLGNRCVAITDLEVAKKVLWARPNGFARSKSVTAAFQKYGVLGVFSFEGEVWKRHRRLISPAFSKVAISKMHHAIEIPLGSFY
jgi:cytochrome P450